MREEIETMETMLEIGSVALRSIGYLFVAYLCVLFNKLMSDLYSRRQKFDVDAAIEQGDGNLAIALRRSGLYLGICIGLYGVIAGPSYGFWKDLILIAGYGILVSFLFLGARVFNDFVILGSLKNTQEVREGNVAVGFVECGGYLATGIIVMSSIMGTGGGLESALVFFIVGQLLLLSVTRVYEWTCGFDMRGAIAEGNASAGLLLGGLMVALAVAVHGAIAIDFVSWSYNLTVFAMESIMAVVFMLLINIAIDRVFLPGIGVKTAVAKKNIAAVTVLTALKLVGAVLISAAVV